MPDRLLAPAAMATLLCLTTTAATAQTPGPTNAEQGWASITRCAQEDSERSRHTCLDRVLRDAGLLTNEMHARQQRNSFGLDEKKAAATPPRPAPTSAAAPAPSASPPAIASTAAPATRASTPAPTAPASTAASPATSAPGSTTTEPDRLEVELAKVEKAANGRLFVTTTDGAVWLQAETVDMPQPPMKGDHMTIRKGSMGGYRCSVTSTHLTYRCVRNR
jgi:hypothetical protein